MGGKKRGAPRQQKRGKEIAEKHLLSITTAGTVVETKQDAELFVIDNVGDAPLSKKLLQEAQAQLKLQKKLAKKELPKQLALKVKKIIKAHENNLPQIEAMAKEAKDKRDISVLKRQQRKIKRTNFNLWEDETSKVGLLNIDPTHNPNLSHTTKSKSIKLVPTTRGVSSSAAGTAPINLVPQTQSQRSNPTSVWNLTSNKLVKRRQYDKFQKSKKPSVAVEVALPGQSYKPDQEQHQDVIGEALTIEIKRKEAEDEKKIPIGGPDGMSEETLAVLIHSSDDNDGSSDDDDDDDADDSDREEVKFLPQKKPGKLTTAKRNKQKRARQQEIDSKARKKQKQLLHSIEEAKRVAKELKQKDLERMEKKEVVEKLKRDTEMARPLGTQLYTKLAEVDPINVPSLPVALTEEIRRGTNGDNASGLYSLRTIKPKGNLLKERLESLADRKFANKKTLKKRKIVQGKKRKAGKNGGQDLFF